MRMSQSVTILYYNSICHRQINSRLYNRCAYENIKLGIDEHLPYILNFSCGKIRSETMLHFLETKEIYVSSGSACAGGKASHVLDAMGLPNDRIDSSMRVSFSRFNTIDQVKPFIDALKEGLDTLAHR